jgi:hypothetical protein
MEVEISTKELQLALPLGPVEIFLKKKLDSEIGKLVKSTTRNESYSLKKAKGLNGSVERIESNRTDTKNNSVEDLIESIRSIVGDHEMSLNEPQWRAYDRIDHDALRYAVHKWNELDRIQKLAIKHPPAWLNSLWHRAQKAFVKARQSK